MTRRLLLSLALLAAAAPAAAGDLTSVVYERTLMREAGTRCGLFAPRVQTALAAGALQARGAAYRAGAASDAVDLAAARASLRASREPCESPDLRTAAERVSAAFSGWGRQAILDLPSTNGGGWRARRYPDRPQPFWALSTRTDVNGATVMMGLRKSEGSRGPSAFAAEAAAPDAGRAYLVRLVVRDPRLAPQPYLATGGAPPASASLSVLASGKTALNGGAAWRWSFPDAAADALAQLDPREHARVEWVFPGERTVSALVEAGDFAVGRAFLSAGD